MKKNKFVVKALAMFLLLAMSFPAFAGPITAERLAKPFAAMISRTMKTQSMSGWYETNLPGLVRPASGRDADAGMTFEFEKNHYLLLVIADTLNQQNDLAVQGGQTGWNEKTWEDENYKEEDFYKFLIAARDNAIVRITDAQKAVHGFKRLEQEREVEAKLAAADTDAVRILLPPSLSPLLEGDIKSSRDIFYSEKKAIRAEARQKFNEAMESNLRSIHNDHWLALAGPNGEAYQRADKFEPISRGSINQELSDEVYELRERTRGPAVRIQGNRLLAALNSADRLQLAMSFKKLSEHQQSIQAAIEEAREPKGFSRKKLGVSLSEVRSLMQKIEKVSGKPLDQIENDVITNVLYSRLPIEHVLQQLKLYDSIALKLGDADVHEPGTRIVQLQALQSGSLEDGYLPIDVLTALKKHALNQTKTMFKRFTIAAYILAVVDAMISIALLVTPSGLLAIAFIVFALGSTATGIYMVKTWNLYQRLERWDEGKDAARAVETGLQSD